MKKDYLRPEVQTVEILALDMLAASSGVVGGEGGTDDFGAGKNRGEWGNVWGK